MMKNRWVMLIACICITVGFMAGGYAGIRFWQSFDEVALETRLMADAKMRLAVLSALKSSNQEKAMQLLEVLLDGDVIGINAVMDSSSRKAELTDTLMKVAKHRTETSYRSSDPTVASAVQHALERVAQPNIAVKRDAPQAVRPLP